MLDTQTFLVGQQDSHTAARGQVVRDLIATYKALGGGWQIRGSTGVLPEATRQDMDARTDWGELLGSDAPETPSAGTLRKPDW